MSTVERDGCIGWWCHIECVLGNMDNPCYGIGNDLESGGPENSTVLSGIYHNIDAFIANS